MLCQYQSSVDLGNWLVYLTHDISSKNPFIWNFRKPKRISGWIVDFTLINMCFPMHHNKTQLQIVMSGKTTNTVLLTFKMFEDVTVTVNKIALVTKENFVTHSKWHNWVLAWSGWECRSAGCPTHIGAILNLYIPKNKVLVRYIISISIFDPILVMKNTMSQPIINIPEEIQNNIWPRERLQKRNHQKSANWYIYNVKWRFFTLH